MNTAARGIETRLAVTDLPYGGMVSKTLLFVHGTGVRRQKYADTMRLIGTQIELQHLPVALRGCYWGDAEGARLRADGRSIPKYDNTGGAAPSETDQILTLWSVLYTDPWYELRLLRHWPQQGPVPAGHEPPSDQLSRMIREFEPSSVLARDLTEWGLAGHFDAALAAIRIAPEFEQAVATAPADPLDHRRAIARALIAYASVAATEANQAQIDGAVRDALTERLTNELYGYGMSLTDFFLRPVKGVAKYVAAKKLSQDRGAITDSAAPIAGDVLRFLANGDSARTFLRRAIDDIDDDVYLLGHSLGGIMCVDLLVRENVPSVKGLITVGSQAPFLYEIGALPGLAHPDPLPEHFPAWLNIYDRRDPLSYIGAGVLGERVVDIEVDNKQPPMESHSAYWSNATMWLEVTAFLR